MDIATTLLEYTAEPNAESKVSLVILINSSQALTFISFLGWLQSGAFGNSRRAHRYGGLADSASCKCQLKVQKWSHSDAPLFAV